MPVETTGLQLARLVDLPLRLSVFGLLLLLVLLPFMVIVIAAQ